MLAWLLAKVSQAREALGGSLSGLDEEAKAAYVVGFLADFLPERWSLALSKHLKVDSACECGGGSRSWSSMRDGFVR